MIDNKKNDKNEIINVVRLFLFAIVIACVLMCAFILLEIKRDLNTTSGKEVDVIPNYIDLSINGEGRRLFLDGSIYFIDFNSMNTENDLKVMCKANAAYKVYFDGQLLSDGEMFDYKLDEISLSKNIKVDVVQENIDEITSFEIHTLNSNIPV